MGLLAAEVRTYTPGAVEPRVVNLEPSKTSGGFAVTSLEPPDPFLSFQVLSGGPGKVSPHPHAGIETVTLLVEGEFRHTNSEDGDEVLSAGQVQVMTAGSGIAHCEESVVPVRGYQLWINLAAASKKVRPAYQSGVPARENIVAGVKTQAPLYYRRAKLHAGRDRHFTPGVADNAFVYVIRGQAVVNELQAAEGQAIVLGPGPLLVRGEGEILIIAAKPHGEPVSRLQGIAMNSTTDVLVAYQRWVSGWSACWPKATSARKRGFGE